MWFFKGVQVIVHWVYFYDDSELMSDDPVVLGLGKFGPCRLEFHVLQGWQGTNLVNPRALRASRHRRDSCSTRRSSSEKESTQYCREQGS